MRCQNHPARDAVFVPLWPPRPNIGKQQWLDHECGVCVECAKFTEVFTWVEIGGTEYMDALPAAKMEEVSNAALYNGPGGGLAGVGMQLVQLTGA